MAITQLNFSPGVYEAITDEPLDSLPVLNAWYYLKIDGWFYSISDIVLKQAGTPLPGAAYELTVDTKYTDREVNESGKTLYAKWRIVNGTYDLIATTISGNNFGTYVNNETVKSKLEALSADNVSYDNAASGLTATDVQNAIDEIVNKLIPVGTIVGWHKTLSGTPSLPGTWVEVNGQTISDSDSVYDGVTLEDINGDARFLRGGSVSGTTQSNQNKAHTHTEKSFVYPAVTDYKNQAYSSAGGFAGTYKQSANTSSEGGAEARPENMAIVWIIKIK